MKKVNAGIKSKKELAQRLMAGEVFYHKGSKLFFDDSFVNPFRCDHEEMYGIWVYFNEFKVMKDWRENIGKGILCWIWDNEESLKELRLVVGYISGEEYPYQTDTVVYRNAKPLTEEEIKEYVLELRT